MQKPQNERQAPGNLKAAEVVLRREVNVSAVLSIIPPSGAPESLDLVPLGHDGVPFIAKDQRG